MLENDVYIKLLSKQYCPLFGKISVDLGFITEKQLEEATAQQVEEGLFNNHHRLIGNILSEHGWITGDQIDIVVFELFEQNQLKKWISRIT
jgi:hypothetical protein